MTVRRAPLLAEWACLGALYRTPNHGFAVSKRLALDGDLGRIWHVTRPLTYRALDQLKDRRWIEARPQEASTAGPNRTPLVATGPGRRRFEAWLATPVEHVRQVRNELLLKVVLADEHGIDIGDMLHDQRRILDAHASTFSAAASTGDTGDSGDVVTAWRREMTLATQRFVTDLAARTRPAARLTSTVERRR